MKVVKIFLSLTVLFVVGVGAYLLFFKEWNIAPKNTVTVKRGEIVEEITITGRLVADISANLAFEKGGRLISWNVSSGEQVRKGQIIAMLESSVDNGQISHAQAGIDRAVAQFDQAVASLDAAELRQMELEDSEAPHEQIAAQAAHVREAEALMEAQRAGVSQAQAALRTATSQDNKNVLTAPFDGILAQQFIDPGEVVNPGTKVGFLIASNGFHIEANVSEVDIARIKIENPVSITFDALFDKTFQGAVETIESSETIIDGVVNYKITIKINQEEPQLRNGLTANLSIETARRLNPLLLPEYAIIEKDEGAFVEKIKNGILEEVPVMIGVRDSNGNIEIISGLLEGEEVVASGLRTDL